MYYNVPTLRNEVSMELPFPRLELRWREATTEESEQSDYSPYAFACDYMLVLWAPTVRDQRSNDWETDEYGVKVIEYKLNTTLSTGRPDRDPSKVEPPFRDGCHASWDGDLLKLPIFATYNGVVTPLETKPRAELPA